MSATPVPQAYPDYFKDLPQEVQAKLPQAEKMMDRVAYTFLALALSALLVWIVGDASSSGGSFRWGWGLAAGFAIFVALSAMAQSYLQSPKAVRHRLDNLVKNGMVRRESLLVSLPPRLQHAPDIIWHVDAQHLPAVLRSRKVEIQAWVKERLAQEPAVDDKQLQAIAGSSQADSGIPEIKLNRSVDRQTQAAQVISATTRLVQQSWANYFSQRMKLVGDQMIRNLGVPGDLNSSVQMAINQATALSAPQLAATLILHLLLSRLAVPFLKDWTWIDVIDTLAAWPESDRPTPVLEAWLDNGWTSGADTAAVRPETVAGRLMCWVRVDPALWKDVHELLDRVSLRRIAILRAAGKLDPPAEQWKPFVAEVRRIAVVFQAMAEHKEQAGKAIKACDLFSQGK